MSDPGPEPDWGEWCEVAGALAAALHAERAARRHRQGEVVADDDWAAIFREHRRWAAGASEADLREALRAVAGSGDPIDLDARAAYGAALVACWQRQDGLQP